MTDQKRIMSQFADTSHHLSTSKEYFNPFNQSIHRQLVIPLVYPWLVHEQVALKAVEQHLIDKRSGAIFILCDYIKDNEECEIHGGARTTHERNILCAECFSSKLSWLRELSTMHQGQVQIITFSSLDATGINISEIHPGSLKRFVQSTLFKRYRVSSWKEYLDVANSDYKEVMEICMLSKRMYLTMHAYIKSLCYEYQRIAVFLFNARFAPYRAIFDAAQKNGVPVLVHERGSRDSTFRMLLNIECDNISDIIRYFSTYDIDQYSNEIYDEQEYMQYMTERMNGKNTGGPAFVGRERLTNCSLTPKGSKYICFFSSSLDEKASSLGIKYADYFNILRACIEVCASQNLKLVVRHHPNLGKIANPMDAYHIVKMLNDYIAHADIDITIIPPEADINSYALASKAEICIAPHSTLFLELNSLGITCLAHSKSYFFLDSIKCFFFDTDEMQKIVERIQSHLDCAILNKDLLEYFRMLSHYYLFSSSLSLRSCSIVNTYTAGGPQGNANDRAEDFKSILSFLFDRDFSMRKKVFLSDRMRQIV
jgi:hypothetical protein